MPAASLTTVTTANKMKYIKIFLSVMLSLSSLNAAAWDIEDIKPIYYELIDFKDSQSFASLGFAPASPHHDWLDRIENFREDKKSDMQMLLEHGFLAGDILMLGQEYRKSKGAETNYSKEMRDKMDEAFK